MNLKWKIFFLVSLLEYKEVLAVVLFSNCIDFFFFPRGQYWGRSCLISLLMIWMGGLSAPSVSLQTTASWEGVLICQRGEGRYRGTWIDGIDGPRLTVRVSIGASVGSCILVTTSAGKPTGLGRCGCKAA